MGTTMTVRNICFAIKTHYQFLLILTGCLLLSTSAVAQLTLTVNSLSDSPGAKVGDGFCETGVLVDINGAMEEECTLRAALQEANQASEAVMINFSDGIHVDAEGLSMIVPQSPLPAISNQVTIAGESHPLYPINGELPGFTINGEDAGEAHGLLLQQGAEGSIIRGISIGNFERSGIMMEGGAGYLIYDNLIGGWVANPAGDFTTFYAGNGSSGIVLSNASAAETEDVSTVFNNLVMANGGDGIVIEDGTSNALIVANRIGLDPKGPDSTSHSVSPESRNHGAGINILEGAGPENVIGVFFVSEPNVIANNGNGGIRVSADAQFITGNHIGVPADGLTHDDNELYDYGNLDNGIVIESSDNVIGGEGSQSNIVGNSQFVGIRIGNGSVANNIAANDNEIRRNLIGIMPTGEAVGQSQGIRIDNGSGNTVIGAEIAHNITGIEFRTSSNDASENTILDNTTGVWIRAGSRLGPGNVVGRSSTGVLVNSRLDAGTAFINGSYIGTNSFGDNLGNNVGIYTTGSGVECSGTSCLYIGENHVGYSSSYGIWLGSDAASIHTFSNFIGVHMNGQPIPNDIGIMIGQSDSAVTNGSYTYFNDIAHNYSDGVRVGAEDGTGQALGHRIFLNSIFSNDGLGISLGPGGGTVDVGGAATGPNRLQNFPELDGNVTSFDSSSHSLIYRFRVQTETSNASYPLAIQFYLSNVGEAQGRRPLGPSVIYESDSAMNWVIGELEIGAHIQVYGDLVATARDADGNTSQFTPSGVFLGEQVDAIFRDRFQSQSGFAERGTWHDKLIGSLLTGSETPVRLYSVTPYRY
jgi:hypothetical protein